MPDTPQHRDLLPAGMKDVLPPDADFEADMVERLMHRFSSWGYQRVKPPLIEFEESLLSGPGEAMRSHTFRLMDPVSQRMMGLRADMTPQVGRIASSRLGREPRPLRLSYAGQVLRVRGEQMRPERQIGQVGIELIGSSDARADAEVVLLAAEALSVLGITGLSVDLNIPTLAPNVARQHGISEPRALVSALDRKDESTVQSLAGGLWPLMSDLLRSVGSIEVALPILQQLNLAGEAALDRDRLLKVVEIIRESMPDITLTIDPTDHRGFEYHTGVTFTFLARNIAGELGRGGRYINQGGEEATGFTLYLDALLQVLQAPRPARRVFVPLEHEAGVARKLREEGWITIFALGKVVDARSEAKRLACQYVLLDGQVVSLEK